MDSPLERERGARRDRHRRRRVDRERGLLLARPARRAGAAAPRLATARAHGGPPLRGGAPGRGARRRREPARVRRPARAARRRSRTCRPACAWSWCATATAARAGSSWRPGPRHRIPGRDGRGRHSRGRRRARAAAARGARAARGVPRRARDRVRAGRGRADRRGPLEHHLPGPRGATRASCCAARRARRCRRPRTTCCARRACCARSRTRRCACPRVLAVGDDEYVLGVPFYVMEEVHGSVITSEIPRRARHAGGAARASARTWSTRSPRCTRSTGARAGSRATASRPATSSASCAASTGCGSTTRRASCRVVQEVRRLARATTCRSRRRRRSCTATTGSATRWSPTTRRRELIAIFDWELSTIGDPLADLGYLTVTWVEPDDPAGHDVRACPRSPAATGFPTREELIARYEERTRPLDVGAQLVPGARAVEGGRVHGGQLQALPGRQLGRRVPAACSTRACRCSPRRPARSRSAREGPAGRLRRRPHHQRLRLVPRLLRGRGARPARRSSGCSARTRGRSSCCAASRRGELTEERVRASASARCSSCRRTATTGSSTGCSAGMQPDEAMVEALRRARARGHQDRADLELVGAGPLRPLDLPRAVRRRRDLRRGGPAQAAAGDLRAGRRARRASRRPSACSWTTCARTARAPRRSG